MKTRKTLQALVALTILLPVLAVFFAACEGGYEPSGKTVNIYFYDDNPGTLKVTVHIPSKITDKFLYQVECDPTTGIAADPEFSPITTISETTIYTLTGTITAPITISVYEAIMNGGTPKHVSNQPIQTATYTPAPFTPVTPSPGP